MTDLANTRAGRRDFLKMATVTAPAAAAVAIVEPGAAQARGLDAMETAMQDTAHTRAYFESARF